ncbi:Conserved DNA-binding protein YbaB [Thermomonospora echinospora]|uniref:Conserved DNA-binding protein YbaB n=1 Tax=Thermomonospora echinospora TaxID=1992 RepID=A0A1H6D2A4_9ACTN|nr:YbaB/EbfC family nucleoid-associated protein [Thermomonospora echinospora]SEG79432.1 Conserved DNA-binding protein YbaB [Thermomonospora echinospora]
MLNFDPDRFQLEDLDKVLAQSQEIVGRIEAAQGRLEEIRGIGEAADGHIRVTCNGQGRVEQIELNPRAMRLDSQTLAEQLTTGVNAAQDDAQRQIGELLGEAMGGVGFDPGTAVDQDRIRKQLDSLTDSFAREMDVRAQDVQRRAR